MQLVHKCPETSVGFLCSTYYGTTQYCIQYYTDYRAIYYTSSLIIFSGRVFQKVVFFRGKMMKLVYILFMYLHLQQ